ncbi:hypothetical protein VTK56DRAFT_4238 [Thermocarpiscus australiensis]
MELKVSPGVSEIPRPAWDPSQYLLAMDSLMGDILNEKSRGQAQRLNELPSSSDSSPILNRYEEIVSRLRQLEQFDTQETRLPSTEPTNTVSAEDDIAIETSDIHERDTVLIGRSDTVTECNPQTEGDTVQGQEIEVSSGTEPRNPVCMPINSSPPEPPLATQQARAPSEGIDADEAWKTFVFGDANSDEVGKAAFEEARYDAVRSLYPSDFSTSPNLGPETEGGSNIATVGTFYMNDDGEVSGNIENRPPSESSASMEATYGLSPAGTDRGQTLDSSDTPVQSPSVEVNPGTTITSGVEIPTDTSAGNGPGFVENAESATSESSTSPPSMTTSMAVVPARSDMGFHDPGASGEQFRFAQPKPFVGSRSNLSHVKRRAEASVGISLTKKKRGRPRKRAGDGRADIRALPNYSSDPIEEFEDEEPHRRSLFPALELT